MVQDKIFIEKKEKIRLIIQHPIKIDILLSRLSSEFKITKLEKENEEEIIVLIEEKEL